MSRPHYIEDRRLEIAAGIGALLAAAALLHDAFDRRAKSMPWWLRPFTWW